MNSLYSEIHKAIHNPKATGLKIDGVLHPITLHSNGCRMLKYGRITFMEQKKDKTKKNSTELTEYAKRAVNGEQITWGIQEGDWILIATKKNN